MPDPSDRLELLASLALAAKNGDRRAFETLVIHTSPAVYSLAYRLVGNEHDASDVVQETYLRAYRSIRKFRGDASVSTWLYRITANCASSHLARRSRCDTAVLDAIDVVDVRMHRRPEEAAERTDERRVLVAALETLSAELRAVVVLHDIYDLSHEAIATELGITRAASKVRLHRARRRLRDVLAAPADAQSLHGPLGTARVRPEPMARPRRMRRAS